MAKLEHTLNGNFNQWLSRIEDGILNGSMSASLEDCGDIKTLNADISFTVKTEPTCTQKGVTAYKATVEFNGNVYTDIKNIADISETGHRFKDGVCLICGEKQESDNSETVTKAPGTTGDNNAADNDAVSKMIVKKVLRRDLTMLA